MVTSLVRSRLARAFLLLPLVVTACATPRNEDPPPDPAADREAVIDAHQALVTAYQNADAAAFVLLLDKSDDLLIFHPRVEDRWSGIDEVQQNLSRMFARVGKSSWLDVHLQTSVHGDVAWLTSQIVIESPGIETPFTGRGTEIWVRRTGGWRLAHGHWSANPEF